MRNDRFSVSFEFFSLSFELGRIELRPRGAETASSLPPAREAADEPGQFEGRMAGISPRIGLLLMPVSGRHVLLAAKHQRPSR